MKHLLMMDASIAGMCLLCMPVKLAFVSYKLLKEASASNNDEQQSSKQS
jgi:hypothetical protein